MILILNERVILVSFWQCQTGRVLPYCLLQTRHNICGKHATCTRIVPRKKLGVTVATLVARHLLHVIANATSLTTRDGAMIVHVRMPKTAEPTAKVFRSEKQAACFVRATTVAGTFVSFRQCKVSQRYVVRYWDRRKARNVH